MPDDQSSLPPKMRVDLEGQYYYPLTVTLAASGFGTSQVQVIQNYDFEVHQVQFTATSSLFSVIWGTTNVFFMPAYVAAVTIFGTGILPHRLIEPVIFPRGSLIAFQFRDDSAAPNTVTLTMDGRLIKYNK